MPDNDCFLEKIVLRAWREQVYICNVFFRLSSFDVLAVF